MPCMKRLLSQPTRLDRFLGLVGGLSFHPVLGGLKRPDLAAFR